MIRVAITGANGYIGSNFIKSYYEKYDLIALTRNENMGDARLASWERTDYSATDLKKLLGTCDAVVHLAYEMATSDNEKRGEKGYSASITTTENVLKTCSELNIDNVVFTSSRLVYPRYKETPFVETDDTKPQNFYARSKVKMELLCQKYNEEYGMNIKILRLGQVIGGDMRVKAAFNVFLEQAQNNATIKLIGKNIRDYIYVKDVCRAIDLSISAAHHKGIYNISMGKGIDNKSMADDIIRSLDSKSSTEIVVDESAIYDKMILDCNKARNELGFSCECEGISDIVKDIMKSVKR